jgi:hypothetical protein
VWLGFLNARALPVPPATALAGSIVFGTGAIVLLIIAVRRAGQAAECAPTLTRVYSRSRRIAKDPPAAPEHPEQLVGRLGRPGPVRRRDRHPRPLERPAALQAGVPAHRKQALRREHYPEPGRQQENASQGGDD